MPFSGTASLCSDSEDDPVNTNSCGSSTNASNCKSSTETSAATYQIIGNCEFVSIFLLFGHFFIGGYEKNSHIMPVLYVHQLSMMCN